MLVTLVTSNCIFWKYLTEDTSKSVFPNPAKLYPNPKISAFFFYHALSVKCLEESSILRFHFVPRSAALCNSLILLFDALLHFFLSLSPLITPRERREAVFTFYRVQILRSEEIASR